MFKNTKLLVNSVLKSFILLRKCLLYKLKFLVSSSFCIDDYKGFDMCTRESVLRLIKAYKFFLQKV